MGKQIGIYGSGTIGACQATLTSGNGYPTVVVGHSKAGLIRCRETICQNWDDLIAVGLATEANKKAAMALVTSPGGACPGKGRGRHHGRLDGWCVYQQDRKSVV